MKKIILISSISFLYSFFSASYTINVRVSGFKSEKGQLYACLYNKADGFPSSSNSAFQCLKSKIIKDGTIISFKDIPEGNYAVAVIHDENLNQKLDENFMGIPKEGYGASNNKLPKMSAPKFEASKFLVDGNKNISINLKY